MYSKKVLTNIIRQGCIELGARTDVDNMVRAIIDEDIHSLNTYDLFLLADIAQDVPGLDAVYNIAIDEWRRLSAIQ